jgi:hypothetical protein
MAAALYRKACDGRDSMGCRRMDLLTEGAASLPEHEHDR